MTERDPLDDLFAAAAEQAPRPSADFMARVFADAEANQRPALAIAPVATPRASGFWARLVAAIGGVSAVAGLGTAVMAGVVIGYVQPDALLNLADSYGIAAASSESVDLLSGYDSLWAEEPTE